jgi:hypothetical protein
MRRALIAAVTAVLVFTPPAAAWTWPADGPVVEKFKLGDDPYAAGQHRGIDIGAPKGAAVLSPISGIVSFAGAVPVSGRTLTIQTRDGYSVTLTHLGSTAPQRGDPVGEGAAIATIGPSGTLEHDVPYVHLGVRRSEDPNGYVDPLVFLPDRPLAPPPAAPTAPAPPPPAPAPAPPAAPASPVSLPAAPPTPAPAARVPVASAPPARSPGASPAVALRGHVNAPDRGQRIRSRPAARALGLPGTGVVAHGRGHAEPRVLEQGRQVAAGAPRGRRRPDGWTGMQSRASLDRGDRLTFTRDADNRETGSLQWHWAVGMLLLIVAVALFGWRRRRGSVAGDPAPIIAGNVALLPDNADLLRELDPAHRARVHDDCGGHPRPPSQAARRRDVLLDRNGRERLEECPGGRAGRCRPEDVRRPPRRGGLASAPRSCRRESRLLHSHH